MTDRRTTATRAGFEDMEIVVKSQWPDREFEAVALDGGMTNRNWKVTVGEETGPRDYAVQLLLPDDSAALIGINRDTHERVMHVVDRLRLGPRLVSWRREAPKAIISEYFEDRGADLAEDTTRAAGLAARALALLHTSTVDADLPGWISDPFEGIDWLFASVETVAPDLAEQFRWAMEVNARCGRARGPYTSCLLHSDLSRGNVLVNPSGVGLIDWEYAGLGDRYYDCADFVEKWELDLDQEQVFLDGYRKDEPLDFLAAVIYMYRFTSRLREGLWAASISKANFIEFDHVGYAKSCLQRLVEIAESPRFDDSVEAVAAARDGRGAR